MVRQKLPQTLQFHWRHALGGEACRHALEGFPDQKKMLQVLLVKIDHADAEPRRPRHQSALKTAKRLAQRSTADAQAPREFGLRKLLSRHEFAGGDRFHQLIEDRIRE